MAGEFKLERNVELSPASKSVAEKELRETPERVRESLARIRELLKQNPDLSFPDDDEIFTVFLRACKWYPESAIEKMRLFAQYKRDNADWIDGLRVEDLKQTMLANCPFCILPYRDHLGRRIIIGNMGDVWDPSKASMDDLFKWGYLVHLVLQMEPETQVNGAVSISDNHNLGWAQISASSPASMKRQANFRMGALPWRLKETHVVRQPMIFSVLHSVLKPLCPEKYKKRMFIHGNKFSSLHKNIPPAYLPSDYGGERPPVKYSGETYYNLLVENKDALDKWAACGFAKK